MMRISLYNIALCCLAAMALAACGKFDDLPVTGGADNIILDLSSKTVPFTRSAAAGAELAIDHLDVLIFSETGDKAWYERVKIGESASTASGRGNIVLGAKRSSFAENVPYWVYLVANSTAEESVFSSDGFDLDALRGLMQSDKMIHLTGLDNVEGAPQTFLMDGIAYLKEGDGTGEPAAPGPVVLYDGNPAANTDLGVTLRRAAAKIVVTLKHGDNVTFTEQDGAGYYLRNMPYSTSVIAGVNAEADRMSTGISSTGYFVWTDEAITVTAYTYAHEWMNGNLLDDEVRLVVNIPMVYDDPDDGVDAVTLDGSYFQVPVSRNKILERNTCYTVNVSVNTPGAEDPSQPELLDDVQYEVAPWDEQTINVGGDDGRPTFLSLNQYELKMHNVEDDNTSIMFTSSSEVTATITKVFFYDKFGQQQVLQKVTGSSDDYGIRSVSWFGTTWTNRCTVRITPDEGLNGKLDVYSTLPENNTIRYVEVTVTNADGNERKLTIEQYPLTYITNIEGYYSYRDDFVSTASDGTRGVTTWELLAGKKINKGVQYNASQAPDGWICGCAWNSRNKTWSYGKTETGFFASKVALNVNESTGLSNIEYARWTETARNIGSLFRPVYTYPYTYNTTTANVDLNNHRMYHVVITASSGEYTLGRPRITDGKTDPGEDNAKLVSPSFMIASQLGAVTDADDIYIAADHCEQYVEVAKDGTKYDDWRLPTEAELNIIMKFQYAENAAMDEVLAGHSYWVANNKTVINTHQGASGDNRIRCIRDAFDTPAGN